MKNETCDEFVIVSVLLRTFSTVLTAEYVYTTDAPPPYPGVDPAYPPPQPMNGVSLAGKQGFP
mgnify:FL=1